MSGNMGTKLVKADIVNKKLLILKDSPTATEKYCTKNEIFREGFLQ